MDQSPAPQPQPITGLSAAPPPLPYNPLPYSPGLTGPPPAGPPPPYPPSPYQQVQHFHHQQLRQQQQQLQNFWSNQMIEIESTSDFKTHSLPLARIKKIMKADEDVRMISAEAPVVFAKACEMFILELTLRSWIHTEENKRRTLQKNDIAAAITRTDIFDFLVDIVPRDELKDDGLSVSRASLPLVGTAAEAVPYYYVPAPGVMMGKPVDQSTAGIYGNQPGHPVAYMSWPQMQAHVPNVEVPPGQDMPENA